MTQPITEKRRKVIRYPAVAYRAEVKRLRGFSRFAKPVSAEVIDYHSEGVGLCSEQRFTVGDKVVMSIFSNSEQVSNIHGVVRYVRCRRNGYWFGVQFADKVKGRVVEPSVLMGLEQMMKSRFG